jgi:hypothetical protein
MSVEAMALVLHHSRAAGTAKVVLLGIANHEGDGGAWPAHATLAKYANVNDRNLRRTLTKLVEMGELAIEVQAGGLPGMAEHQRPNRYRVLVRCPKGCDGTTRHHVQDEVVYTEGAGAPGGRAAETSRGRSQEPSKPSYEPSEEPSSGSRGASTGSPGGERAQEQPKIPRQRRKPQRKPLTQEQRTVCYRNFCELDLFPLEDDEETKAAAFIDLEDRFDAFEPDKWASSKIAKGEWEHFVGTVGLGSEVTFDWGGRKIVRA